MPFSDRDCLKPERERVFGAGHSVPLDRNAKARIMVYVRAYNARVKEVGQHTGPITCIRLDQI